MGRRGAMSLVGGTLAALLQGCGLLKKNSYRFRLTVEVETLEGIKAGSSVYKVRGFKTYEFITGGTSSDAMLEGEAVAVDLPDGKTLFALLKRAPGESSNDSIAIISMRAMDPRFANNKADSAERIASGDSIISPAQIEPNDIPILVTFRDIGDPASVELVDPANLSAVFGFGIRLSRLVVEVTDRPVTKGIEARLGWLRQIGRERSRLRTDVPRYLHEAELIHHITPGDFSTELYK